MKHDFLFAPLVGLALLCGLTATPTVAAPADPAGAAGDLPIHITSDAMTYDTNKNTVVFQGNVEEIYQTGLNHAACPHRNV